MLLYLSQSLSVTAQKRATDLLAKALICTTGIISEQYALTSVGIALEILNTLSHPEN
jgi:hypothetical protein